MSESKHTPGPWSAGTYCLQPTVFWDKGNGTVAIASIHDGYAKGDPKANARLIAAAPDLLEALKAVKGRRICWPKEIEEKVVAALAKAEGRDA